MLKFIQNFLVVLAVFVLIQNTAFSDMIEFAQVGDVHYTLGDDISDKYLYFLSSSLRKKSPEFVVFLGDNVDKSKEENVIGFMRAIHTINFPYYIVLGKNDAHSFSGLEKEIYLDIVSAFNSNQDSKKKYYFFKPNKDIVCVVMDDTSDFVQSVHGEISDEQLAWLEKLLIKYPKRLFVIFHHSPLLPPRIEYKLSMLNTEKYQNLVNKYKNIIIISSGQYHQNSVQTDENGIRHISAPSFKDIPHSYQLIKIIYDIDSYKTPKDVEVEVTTVKI